MKNNKKLQINYLAIDTIYPSENNPRLHSDEQIAILQKSISKFGFNVPILINSENKVICGHGRLEAAKRNGLKEVPTIPIEGLTDSEIEAFKIADNQISTLSTWDFSILKEQIDELKNIDFDTSILGFDDLTLKDISGGLTQDYIGELGGTLYGNDGDAASIESAFDSYKVVLIFDKKYKTTVQRYFAKEREKIQQDILEKALDYGSND